MPVGGRIGGRGGGSAEEEGRTGGGEWHGSEGEQEEAEEEWTDTLNSGVRSVAWTIGSWRRFGIHLEKDANDSPSCRSLSLFSSSISLFRSVSNSRSASPSFRSNCSQSWCVFSLKLLFESD